MTGDEVKAYLYLLCESWLQDIRATLPNNDEELALMARLDKEKWYQVRKAVMRKFIQHPDHKGRIYNERLMEVSNLSEIRRKSRNNKSGTKPQQSGIKVLTAREDEDETESEEKKEKKRGIKKGEVKFPKSLDNEKFLKAWQDWQDHRIEKKSRLTPTTKKRQLAKLEKLGSEAAVSAIEFSIEKGYTGIFEETGQSLQKDEKQFSPAGYVAPQENKPKQLTEAEVEAMADAGQD